MWGNEESEVRVKVLWSQLQCAGLGAAQPVVAVDLLQLRSFLTTPPQATELNVMPPSISGIDVETISWCGGW